MVKLPDSESGTHQDPPSAQSPFADIRCYLMSCCVLSNSMIIRTHSCCRGKPHNRINPDAHIIGINIFRRILTVVRKKLHSPVPQFRQNLCTTSGSITFPSSLILTHAPDQNPPGVFDFFTITPGLCRLLSAPAGSWPFPTLSPQSV